MGNVVVEPEKLKRRVLVEPGSGASKDIAKYCTSDIVYAHQGIHLFPEWVKSCLAGLRSVQPSEGEILAEVESEDQGGFVLVRLDETSFDLKPTRV
jgi:hypothetical protein